MANDQLIIIKKVVKRGHGGHHGGAWKVAYADFVTAMMAFFLLLWLLNVSTDEQKSGIADYFAPAAASLSTSGSGGALGGRTLSADGSKVSDSGMPAVVMSLTPPSSDSEGDEDGGETEDGEADATTRTIEEISEQQLREELAAREQEAFDSAVDSIEQAIQDIPELAELSRNLMIDTTPEGLRIQLVDQDQRSMFPSGKAALYDHTRTLLGMVARIAEKLPNKIKIAGHTDARPFRNSTGYSNWELSSDRANASRRALIEAGLPASRIAEVTGRAATEPLLPDDPNAPSNRRISIILLRQNDLPAAPHLPGIE